METTNGTMNIEVDAGRIEEARERIAKLQRWCEKNGIAPPSFEWGDPACVGYRVHDRTTHSVRFFREACPAKRAAAITLRLGDEDRIVREMIILPLTVRGLESLLRINADYELAGVLTHAAGKTLATVCKGKTIPEAVLERGGECDHCGCKRSRTETFVLQHAATAELKVVGRTCIRPWLGLDPKRVVEQLRFLEWIGGAGAAGDGEEREWIEERDARGIELRDATMLVRAATAALWSNNGYLKFSEGSTRSNAALTWLALDGPNIWAGMDAAAKEEERSKYRELTELMEKPEVIAEATAALEWAKEMTPRGDFDLTLASIARAGFSTPRTNGCAIYLPAAHRRATDNLATVRTAPRAFPMPEATDCKLPDVGAKVAATVAITTVRPFENDWGMSWLVAGRTVEGYEVKLFTSSSELAELAEAARASRDAIALKATVKAHDTGRDGRPVAVLTRAKAC